MFDGCPKGGTDEEWKYGQRLNEEWHSWMFWEEWDRNCCIVLKFRELVGMPGVDRNKDNDEHIAQSILGDLNITQEHSSELCGINFKPGPLFQLVTPCSFQPPHTLLTNKCIPSFQQSNKVVCLQQSNNPTKVARER
jgi:hypothetical protein